MACCELPPQVTDGDGSFSIDFSAVTFGAGCLSEIGDNAQELGLERVALITDSTLARIEPVSTVIASLQVADVDVAVFDEVMIEPTSASFAAASEFVTDARVDGVVSVGGGSVIDTAKAANLFACHPAEFIDYVNAPIGGGQPVPGPLMPHIACPTTSGTGSESTGVAVVHLESHPTKSAIVSKRLRPTRALVDPECTSTLPAPVVAASGFDVLSHALESYTARSHHQRAVPERPRSRPASQGANPWSDMGCAEALRLTGEYLVRAVSDPADQEARHQMMWAATLAGIAFGNAGCHAPHAMSYPVSALATEPQPDSYPAERPIVPHGTAVILNSPAVFRHTAPADPERHLKAAGWLGAPVDGAGDEDAGPIIAERIQQLMKQAGQPSGLVAIGLGPADIDAMSTATLLQQRLVDNAPCVLTADTLAGLYDDAMAYW